MHDDLFPFGPPPPPPPPEVTAGSRRAIGNLSKVLISVGLLAGAGVGGFAIAQAASAPSASTFSGPSNLSGAPGAVQVAATPSATATPKHNCPNMGGSHSSSGSNASATTTIFMR